MDMIEDARARLIAHRKTVTLQSIADVSGLSLGWLSQFQNRKIEFPATRQLNKLLDYLRSQGA